MTADRFTGIVIAPGSEHDGKRLSSKTPFLRRPKIEPAPTTRRGVGLIKRAAPFDEFYWADVAAGSLQSGIWVPDGRDVAWALQQLIAGYRRPL